MIIVSGSSRGLGRSICERLVSNGVEVLGLSRSSADVGFNNLQCDVSCIKQVKNVSAYVKDNNLKVDGLINAAGIASMNLAMTTPYLKAKEIIDINFMGVFNMTQVFAPYMIRNRNGYIINFSTIAVHLALKGESVYVASKAAVEAFSKTFAREVESFGITVNCIAPGPIDTDLLNGITREQKDKIVNSQIIKKQFTQSDICDLVEIISNPKFSSITGHVLNVGGV